MAAFSSRSAPAYTLDEGHAVGGASDSQCCAGDDRDWRAGRPLVDAQVRLGSASRNGRISVSERPLYERTTRVS